MSTSTTDRALVAQVRQYTEPASHAMSAAGGRGVVVGRYTRSVAVVVSDAVVQVTDGMIDSPIAARVDTATLDALQDGIDDVALVLSSRASLVPTLLLPGSAVPARRRLELLREAAGVYAADSWLATTPAQLSGARHLAAVVASLTAGSGIDEPALVSIVGRGAGLTPAGDDAIVGVLAASMAAGRLEEADRRHLLRLLDTRGRELTTPVSYTILRCAAAGHFSGALLALVRAAASGQTADPGSVAAAVAAHGHTSGSDALFGVLTFWNHYVNERS